jgi:hypothetical protein
MIKRNPKDYTSIFANENHIPITDSRKIAKYDYPRMALFYKGVYIGSGELNNLNKKKQHLNTEGVRLEKKYRNKGHGIHLYHHLISTAIRIGAKRIYSSSVLNKFSRRMWAEKLSKFYKMKEQKTRKTCRGCGCSEPRVERWYIEL